MVRLKRVPTNGDDMFPQRRFTAQVKVINGGGEPFQITVWASNSEAMPWMVESDCERHFKTLRDARAYISRFFEQA